MAVIEYFDPLLVLVAITGLFSLYFLISFCLKVKKVKLLRSIGSLFMTLSFSFITFSIAMLMLGTLGYKALSREELIADIIITPTGEQHFNTRFIYKNGSQQIFAIRGD